MGKNANEQSILDINFKRVQQNLLSHFEDIIPNDITRFPEIEKKVSGFTKGYIAQYRYIVFSKMNDKFPLWYYQPKVVIPIPAIERTDRE